ncbi:hypothetical protein [Streptomyces cavernicola]|uniref:Secreted protein n=1 Tax=Streptomyces cavernicola TaxID=3043613 RepID=A0ABT6SNF3_9ACTN|nr:hypothetical protein [Streptomyces sp. B-S-A6]MDI3409459.1 hypothetical protein [Streptomyces sp. B-S-A6]
MDFGAVLIAVTGVAGTLGGALLTQRGADRTKRRELETAQALQEARENRELRRSCYSQLHRDARQFTTALSRHLYVVRDRQPGDEDVRALEETKDVYRGRWSEALMVAPDTVIAPARAQPGADPRLRPGQAPGTGQRPAGRNPAVGR